MKLLLIVILLLNTGKTDIITKEYDDMERCKIGAAAAMAAVQDVQEVTQAVAVCTDKLQRAPEGIVAFI